MNRVFYADNYLEYEVRSILLRKVKVKELLEVTIGDETFISKDFNLNKAWEDKRVRNYILKEWLPQGVSFTKENVKKEIKLRGLSENDIHLKVIQYRITNEVWTLDNDAVNNVKQLADSVIKVLAHTRKTSIAHERDAVPNKYAYPDFNKGITSKEKAAFIKAMHNFYDTIEWKS